MSQQFAGNKRTFNGLVVKPESTLVIVEVESREVVESTDVVESTNVESTDVVKSTDVIESTDVVQFTDVSGSSGETLNLLERGRFIWCSSGTCV